MNQNNNTFTDLNFLNLTLLTNTTENSTSDENTTNNTGQLPVPRFVFGIVAGLWVFMLCAPIVAPTIEKWKADRNKQNSEEDNVELNSA